MSISQLSQLVLPTQNSAATGLKAVQPGSGDRQENTLKNQFNSLKNNEFYSYYSAEQEPLAVQSAPLSSSAPGVEQDSVAMRMPQLLVRLQQLEQTLVEGNHLPSDGNSFPQGELKALFEQLTAVLGQLGQEGKPAPQPTGSTSSIQRLVGEAALPEAAVTLIDWLEAQLPETAIASSTAGLSDGNSATFSLAEFASGLQRALDAIADETGMQSSNGYAISQLRSETIDHATGNPTDLDKGKAPEAAQVAALVGALRTALTRLSKSLAGSGGPAPSATGEAVAAAGSGSVVLPASVNLSSNLKGGFAPGSVALPLDTPVLRSPGIELAGSGSSRAVSAAFNDFTTIPLPAQSAVSQVLAQQGPDGPRAGLNHLSLSINSLDAGVPGQADRVVLAGQGQPGPVAIADNGAARGLPGLAESQGLLFRSQLDLPLGSAQFGGQFVQRIGWLVSQGIAAAEIQLNPAELGPLQVRVEQSEQAARVAFAVQHSATRDALEAQLPRLRELFSEQGLDLVEVESHSFADQQAASQGERDRTEDDSAALSPAGSTATLQEMPDDKNGILTGTTHLLVANYALVDLYA